MIGPRRIEEPPSAEETQRKMQDELRRERLSVRGELGSLPVDRDRARREITDEERVLRNSRPRNRRWRALEKLDREVDRLTHEHAAAIAELQAAEQALAAAPDHDARTLADWLAAGQRGERPVATVYERTRERDAAQLNIDAIAVELDRALERRVKHVERHRKNMLADARRDVTDAQQRLARGAAAAP
jgi:hypothetical protein